MQSVMERVQKHFVAFPLGTIAWMNLTAVAHLALMVPAAVQPLGSVLIMITVVVKQDQSLICPPQLPGTFSGCSCFLRAATTRKTGMKVRGSRCVQYCAFCRTHVLEGMLPRVISLLDQVNENGDKRSTTNERTDGRTPFPFQHSSCLGAKRPNPASENAILCTRTSRSLNRSTSSTTD